MSRKNVVPEVHKVKFAIRREANADTRMQAIEETLSSFEDSQKEMHPELFAEMLCLRSRETLKVPFLSRVKLKQLRYAIYACLLHAYFIKGKYLKAPGSRGLSTSIHLRKAKCQP